MLSSATTAPVSDCTGTGTPQSPNPVYGAGRLDVLKAVETVLGTRNAIAASVTPARSGRVDGVGPVASGTTVTLTATAQPGYRFINWTENGVEVSTDATYVFTSVGNRSLVAHFALFPERLWLPVVAR